MVVKYGQYSQQKCFTSHQSVNDDQKTISFLTTVYMKIMFGKQPVASLAFIRKRIDGHAKTFLSSLP